MNDLLLIWMTDNFDSSDDENHFTFDNALCDIENGESEYKYV